MILKVNRVNGSVVLKCDTPELRAEIVDGVVKEWLAKRPAEPVDPHYNPQDKSNFRSCCDPVTE